MDVDVFFCFLFVFVLQKCTLLKTFVSFSLEVKKKKKNMRRLSLLLNYIKSYIFFQRETSCRGQTHGSLLRGRNGRSINHRFFNKCIYIYIYMLHISRNYTYFTSSHDAKVYAHCLVQEKNTHCHWQNGFKFA